MTVKKYSIMFREYIMKIYQIKPGRYCIRIAYPGLRGSFNRKISYTSIRVEYKHNRIYRIKRYTIVRYHMTTKKFIVVNSDIEVPIEIPKTVEVLFEKRH